MKRIDLLWHKRAERFVAYLVASSLFAVGCRRSVLWLSRGLPFVMCDGAFEYAPTIDPSLDCER